MQTFEINKKIIKAWLPKKEIEENAMMQIEIMSTLPFLYKHIAIMPDVHCGYGVTIGSVMSTKRVVIPNAVGVDIGCFTEDTKVKLADNRDLSFKELIKEENAGKTNYCYTLDENNNIIIEKIIKPRKTKEVKEIIEITLDNDKTIKCTTNHVFYLRNGKEIKAEKLKENDSLMSLYISKASEHELSELSYTNKKNKLSEYYVVYNPSTNKHDFCHHLADEYNHRHNIYNTKGIRHHIDFNKYNNSPENIQICEWKEHWKIHYTHVAELNKKGICGWKAGWRKNIKEWSILSSIKMKKLHNDPEFIKNRDIRASNIIKEYNASKECHEMTRKAGKRGKKYIIKHNTTPKKCNICNKLFANPSQEYWHQDKEHAKLTTYKFSPNASAIKNHKILNIKKIQLDSPISVYCLTVNNYHNFALSSGVFVHNCGMCAVKTSLTEINTDTLKKIMGEIRKVIPVGRNKHQEEQDSKWFNNNSDGLEFGEYIIVTREFSNAKKSIATLGGGNHFIEIQKGDDGHIWIMIHSGSRNLGKQVADHYNKLAIELNKKWHSSVPKEWQLAFLPLNSEEGKAYIREMQYCVDFALANRRLMMDRVKDCFMNHFDTSRNGLWMDEEIINIAHNYARMENHFGENVMIHRKGATLATEDTIGIIPGSQGTKSYITKGKGNADSFNSCSHGAGRTMSRKQAREKLNLKDEIEILNKQGIVHSIRNQNDLDEAPSSYKNIDEVMKNQEDLVEVLVELQPLAVIKG